MFAADVGSLIRKYPVTTLAGNFLEAARRDDARDLRIRDFSFVESGGDPNRGLVQTCGRLGWRAQHLRAVRRSDFHE